MRKLILLTIAFITINTAVKAQEKKSFIEVAGTTTYKKSVEKYHATIIISEDMLYNNGSERFADLKEMYLTKVKASNIDISKFKESEFQYLTTGYNKEGTVFNFETKSRDEFIKGLKIKSLGVVVFSRYVSYKLVDTEVLSKKAIDNARQKAEKIAKNTNKKVGSIILIKDDNINEIRESIYEDNTVVPVNYQITVRFELL